MSECYAGVAPKSQSKWELFGFNYVVFPLPDFHRVSGSPRKPCIVRSVLEWAEVD